MEGKTLAQQSEKGDKMPGAGAETQRGRDSQKKGSELIKKCYVTTKGGKSFRKEEGQQRGQLSFGRRFLETKDYGSLHREKEQRGTLQRKGDFKTSRKVNAVKKALDVVRGLVKR